MFPTIVLVWALACLVLASALVLIDLRREWIKAQRRREFRSQLARDLARDKLIHDKGEQINLNIPEYADDYLSIMADREEWRDRASAGIGILS